MRAKHFGKGLLGTQSQYPLWGIIGIVGLIMTSPFLASLPSYLAFLLCLIRVIRYNEQVFAADYCVLLPFSIIFRTSWGMALQVYLCLFAVIWYLIRGSLKANTMYVLMIIVLNYLVLRMQLKVTSFLLCFGPLSLLCVLLPKQDTESAERTVKAFCTSLIVASVYALLLRSTPQIRAICGAEVPPFRGTTLRRFQGLFQDPNFYMYQLVVGMALLVKLKECRRISSPLFWSMGGSMAFFGILTYSKTFLLVFILLVAIYILWQFWNRKFLRGSLLTVVGIGAVAVLLFAEFSPFAVVLTRLTNATSISELTTGRSDVFTAYYNEITRSWYSLLFGVGMAAEGLAKDPHNLYLEIVYYIGIVGFVLLSTYFSVILTEMVKKNRHVENQNLWAKYAALLIVLVLHMTLHGMFAVVTYGSFMLVFLSILLTKKKEAN